jgi:hypothetical protein
MKKFLMLFALVSATAFAEPSFQQIEGLINQQQYAAAESGLEQIIQNHPNSAKAYYAMAQAQAGLGNQQKAQFALNKAKGLDPELKFASGSNIESLEQAITPQTKKIEAVEESHFWRNVLVFLVAVIIGYFVLFRWILRKNNEDEDNTSSKHVPPKPMPPTPGSTATSTDASRDQAFAARSYHPGQAPSTAQPAPASQAYAPSPAPSTTVVNNHYGSNNDGFVTGMLVGEMMGSHPRETVIVEQPVYAFAQPPAPAYTPPSRDSSWDNDSSSSSSKSSSWDSDDSSSKSSSSWSSSSSSDDSWSSSSDSSSSWDSGSSSSDSSSDW